MPSTALPLNPAQLPTTQVRDSIPVRREELKATSQEIAQGKRSNAITCGLVGGAIFAGVGYYFSRHTDQALAATLGATAAGGAASAFLGHTLTTTAENRSQALLTAYDSANFPTQLKKEMARRENSSFWSGFAMGMVCFWR